MSKADTIAYRKRFVGLDVEVPTLNGRSIQYVNFDNAASTPPFLTVQKGLERFLEYYASVHRGTGFKSQLSTWCYETSRQRTLSFVGADPRGHVCVFVKNTTEAINKVARRLPFDRGDLILTTEMEHHSDDLPFRAVGKVVRVGLTADGRLDEDDFDRKLEAHRDRLALVAVTGASNVTGYLNPIHRLAEKAHAVGALILVDCAQLAPHRQIEVRSLDDPSHLDFVAFSAHKMYAPFGTGALVARRDFFEVGEPDQLGGGTIEIVTLEDVVFADPPERDEAGSPNVVGAVALALAIRELESIGMKAVATHEAELTAYALERLSSIPKVEVFGDRDPNHARQRLGVIPFRVEGLSHFLVAAVLGYEFGIGVRSGCFCAHPYIMRLLGLDRQGAQEARRRVLSGDKRQLPGLVRVSFGLYNTTEEVDRLIEALEQIARGGWRGRYHQDRATGEWLPQSLSHAFNNFVDLL